MRKIRRPRCFSCGDEMKFLYEDDDNIGFKNEIKQFVKNNIKTKIYERVNVKNGAMVIVKPGYGSIYDDEELVVGLCDECIMYGKKIGRVLEVKKPSIRGPYV